MSCNIVFAPEGPVGMAPLLCRAHNTGLVLPDGKRCVFGWIEEVELWIAEVELRLTELESSKHHHMEK